MATGAVRYHSEKHHGRKADFRCTDPLSAPKVEKQTFESYSITTQVFPNWGRTAAKIGAIVADIESKPSALNRISQ